MFSVADLVVHHSDGILACFLPHQTRRTVLGSIDQIIIHFEVWYIEKIFFVPSNNTWCDYILVGEINIRANLV